MSTRIELKLPSELSFLGIPDAILQEIGSDLGCCTGGLEDLGSAVIEACTNAMEHGNRLQEDKDIQITFEIDGLTIQVTVLDHGPGFDFEGWEPSDDLMRPRGRGILIMRGFTDSLEFDHAPDGRFRIRLIKVLATDEEGDDSSEPDSP